MCIALLVFFIQICMFGPNSCCVIISFLEKRATCGKTDYETSVKLPIITLTVAVMLHAHVCGTAAVTVM